MRRFKQRFKQHVALNPEKVALMDRHGSISYRCLNQQVEQLTEKFAQLNCRRIGIAVENSPAWVAFDLAAIFADRVTAAVPHFFSNSQIEHLLNDAQIDSLLIEKSFLNHPVFAPMGDLEKIRVSVFGREYYLLRLQSGLENNEFDKDVLKISYTSGTTGTPKGVVIGKDEVDQVVDSIASATKASADDRHVSVLPLSLLLENIAGIYTALAVGGCCLLPNFEELGMSGSSDLNVAQLMATLKVYSPTTMITVPALAQALVDFHAEQPWVLDSIRFIAVGGAPLANSVIKRAREIGLPLFEGYGLTECSSVVAINLPEADKIGSVGKALPHCRIRIAPDNEIWVRGAKCKGYLSLQAEHESEFWPTGDLGYLDSQGYLYITGRKSTSYCTAFGRNVSPEWIERELVAQASVDQAWVYGESRDFNLAIIVPSQPDQPYNMDQLIKNVNEDLPDYARIHRWLLASEPFSLANQQLNINGSLKRKNIAESYRREIENIYG